MKNILKNKSSSVSVIVFSLVMVFMTSFISLVLHNRVVYDKISQELSYLVELKSNINESDIAIAKKQVESQEGVFGLKYISSESALEMMSSEIDFVGQDFISENPFKEHLEFHIEASKTKGDIQRIIEKIKTLENVNNVFYQEIIVDNIKRIMYLISIGMLILSLILLFVNYSLLYNSIKLLIFTNHKEIKIMQLVGARDSFIKKPYIASIMQIIYKSAIWHVIIIVVLLLILFYFLPSLMSFFNPVLMIISVLIVTAMSFLISNISSKKILNGLLK